MKLQAYQTDTTDALTEVSQQPIPPALRLLIWDTPSEPDQSLVARPYAEVFVRRAFDLVGSAVLLTLFAPLFLVLAIIVKTDSSGSILFKQRRVGKNGQVFWLYKFRSMIADAEARRIALEKHNEASGPLFKMKQDPRITRCGRWMRRYSLDELPQLLNVFLGDMSLVGPRPALPAEVAQYNAWERQRLMVKPGMTGLWQVSGRSTLSFEQSINLDVTYVRTQSLWLDFTILLKTFKAVVTGHGAY